MGLLIPTLEKAKYLNGVITDNEALAKEASLPVFLFIIINSNILTCRYTKLEGKAYRFKEKIRNQKHLDRLEKRIHSNKKAFHRR